MARPKKDERFRVTLITAASGRKLWRLDGYWPDGRRERKRFKIKADAYEYRAKIENEASGQVADYQLQRTSLSREELSDAEVARGLTKGRALGEIVSHYLKLEETVSARMHLSLDQAVEYLLKHYRPELEEVSVTTAITRFLGGKEHARPKTLSHYESSLKLLQRLDPNTLVHRIGLRELESLLSKYKNLNTQKTYRRGLNTFFNWCVRRHHCLENPCSRLDSLPADSSPVRILRFEEVRRLLRAALLYQEGIMAPVVAIGIFAGLRPSEIEDLKPSNIRDEFIVVTGGKLRRKMNRRVPLPDILKNWLSKYPFDGLPAGSTYKMKSLKKATGAEVWVQDIIRHTSISYQLERDRDEAHTAFNNGTSRAMIDSHYRDVVEDPQEVEAYWSLTPESLEGVEVELPAGQGFDDWPTDKVLSRLVWEKPLRALGAELGVSDNAVRKRCLARGIELPKNGYWQRQHARERFGRG
ncbi:hypothetical protein H5P28_15085 [Ruficoccus amylovorans]|uniref:Uncharacterized protein n=1 Tax=Ruficoccus amylovorans TaxID=1804625 RepID=A0A842HHE1_9BACT|nr:hypothetical protein [Ruficoccus amylovorans]MBC2595437.1 hypothetical protein [Ruficoccus amylovorans]MBC2595440.1 hypothetical protein [Ruficoccus amylovorans]MBC2595590.1 hypothetical protein [Ruficoccus amylovorans]